MVDFDENDRKYERFLIGDLDIPEPPAGLERKVIRRIKSYERRMLIVKTVGFGALFAASAAAVCVAYINLMSAATQSGFFAFTSLFFSDFGATMSNFQDFALSMIESFPVFSASFLLAGVIAVIWSAMHLVDEIGQARGHGGLATG